MSDTNLDSEPWVLAVLAAAPGQAERIAELEARAVDILNELRAEQRAHDFTKSDCIKLLEVQNAALLKALEHLVEINRRDDMGDPDKMATNIWRNQAWGNAENVVAKAKEMT